MFVGPLSGTQEVLNQYFMNLFLESIFESLFSNIPNDSDSLEIFYLEQDSWEYFWKLPTSESSNAQEGVISAPEKLSASDRICCYYLIQ